MRPQLWNMLRRSDRTLQLQEEPDMGSYESWNRYGSEINQN